MTFCSRYRIHDKMQEIYQYYSFRFIQVKFKNALFSWGMADFTAVAQAIDCNCFSLYLFWLYFTCSVFVSERVHWGFLSFEIITCSNIWSHVRGFLSVMFICHVCLVK